MPHEPDHITFNWDGKDMDFLRQVLGRHFDPSFDYVAHYQRMQAIRLRYAVAELGQARVDELLSKA